MLTPWSALLPPHHVHFVATPLTASDCCVDLNVVAYLPHSLIDYESQNNHFYSLLFYVSTTVYIGYPSALVSDVQQSVWKTM